MKNPKCTISIISGTHRSERPTEMEQPRPGRKILSVSETTKVICFLGSLQIPALELKRGINLIRI